MNSAADALWEINNEYRKRLSQLMSHMKLLEQILKMSAAEPGFRAAMRRIRSTLEEIDAEHHMWRHTYFYSKDDQTDKRRMVSDPRAIDLALHTFSQMLARHTGHYQAITGVMADLPRPDPAMTKVIRGNDLWEMCLDGVQDLGSYDAFFQQQVSGEPI